MEILVFLALGVYFSEKEDGISRLAMMGFRWLVVIAVVGTACYLYHPRTKK